MSDLDIPMIEASVNYTKVPPINEKRTIAFINHFISYVVTYLNKFSLSCEEKLFEFENKLQRVEASLILLETKLSTILPENEIKQEKNVASVDLTSEAPTQTQEQNTDSKDESIKEDSKIDESSTQKTKLDPVYAKYFKMVQVGVPKPAVKLKMEQEGLDSSVLD
ncbi:hypothetical protein TKK_0005843 [Trichogramma kaykai]|uniref:Coiled-coil domain-containing protein 53 n=1 Tax=Trichogramma kaykai TaxID=54128 RepID=A0ABD2XFV5_9HYME